MTATHLLCVCLLDQRLLFAVYLRLLCSTSTCFVGAFLHFLRLLSRCLLSLRLLYLHPLQTLTFLPSRPVPLPPMEEVTSEIAAALTSIPSPGAFCTSGTLRTLPSKGVHLRGEAGAALGLPLSDAGASAFKAAATPAPFGRGSATVVDPTVRSALQAAVRLAPSFVPALTAKVLPHVCSRLGVAPVADVALQLDKAVLYEVGGHFARHQDTQRSAGMFGTLVLVLPTAARHAGGVLEVSHQGDTRDVDSAAMLYPDIDGEGEEEEAAAAPAPCFVAFFAVCYHRLRKVTAGRRFCLLFNLVRVESSPSAGRAFGRADAHADRRARIGAAVRRWEALPDGNTVLAVPLRHMYTKQGLAFRNLKPEDAAVAKVLQACTTGSEGGAERLLVTHLVTVERCVRGIPDSDSCYDSRDASGGRHFIEDVLEEDVSPELWRNEADEEVKDPDLMVYVSGGDGGDDVISEMKEDFELWPEEPDRETSSPTWEIGVLLWSSFTIPLCWCYGRALGARRYPYLLVSGGGCRSCASACVGPRPRPPLGAPPSKSCWPCTLRAGPLAAQGRRVWRTCLALPWSCGNRRWWQPSSPAWRCPRRRL